MEVIRFSRVQSTAGVSYHLRFADQDDLHVSEKNLLRSSVLSNALAATDEDEDHAGVFQAPTGLVRNYLVFSQRISQDEPLVNDSNNSLVLALKVLVPFLLLQWRDSVAWARRALHWHSCAKHSHRLSTFSSFNVFSP